jgi:hypothetical protein
LGCGPIGEGDPAGKKRSRCTRRLEDSPSESESGVLLTSVKFKRCAHHLPSQLNEPIPVDPEETLLQRLPKPITDSSINLKRTRKVSDAFPDRPLSVAHLQIIVTLRGKRLARHFFI